MLRKRRKVVIEDLSYLNDNNCIDDDDDDDDVNIFNFDVSKEHYNQLK
jgi:hypothetical protein